ncbi:RNase P/MRP, p29 subunit [Gonapodya prolifera JEL478]|uniref:RNase P/MRP, p29 subunit n=1 Tax=Gonapodya prolifera (strain JEL478) TaxID=1344416 RepID=A0A139AY19_GONPJ|nr:RNase P/MRP, p29 subunit [Gonapodya prolifera JEL478]|eukprot:KXS21463.1 RNase P/MRP, p29 subunit [Gonapodya prolifera JEL478]
MSSTWSQSLYSSLPKHSLESLEAPPNHPAATSYVGNFVQSAISSSSPALPSNLPVFTTSSVAAFQSRLENRSIPLDSPSLKQSNPGLVEDRKAIKKSRNKSRKKGMTAKERRTWGAWEVPKHARKFELFVPLWQLWGQYTRELFAQWGGGAAQGGRGTATSSTTPSLVSSGTPLRNLESQLPKLVKADYHGAFLTVVKSRCPGYVGMAGIVVRETENTFILCPPEGGFKTVPKAHSVFAFSVPVDTENSMGVADGNSKIQPQPSDPVFHLYGDHIQVRASERSSKKFRQAKGASVEL